MPIQEMTKPAKKSGITKWLVGLPLFVLALLGIGCIAAVVIVVLFLILFSASVAVPVSA